MPAHEVTGSDTRQIEGNGQAVAKPDLPSSEALVRPRAGHQRTREAFNPARSPQPAHDFHVFHERKLRVAADGVEHVAPYQQPLVSIDQPGQALAHPLPRLHQAPEPAASIQAKEKIRRTRTGPGTEHGNQCRSRRGWESGIGVQEEEPWRIQDPSSGVHLGSAPPGAGNALRARRACESQGFVSRSTVGDHDACSDRDSGEVGKKPWQVMSFVERRDHHPEDGPGHGSVSFSVQSYSKKSTSTPEPIRNSASACDTYRAKKLRRSSLPPKSPPYQSRT